MTLHGNEREVGVRALHDRLSEHLDSVEQGVDIVVTRRGKRIARLTSLDASDPLRELAERGLIQMPSTARTRREATAEASGSVAALVAEQRR